MVVTVYMYWWKCEEKKLKMSCWMCRALYVYPTYLYLYMCVCVRFYMRWALNKWYTRVKQTHTNTHTTARSRRYEFHNELGTNAHTFDRLNALNTYTCINKWNNYTDDLSWSLRTRKFACIGVMMVRVYFAHFVISKGNCLFVWMNFLVLE